MTRLFRTVAPAAAFAIALALSACATPPPQTQFPKITFQHLAPIRLDVAEVTVEQAYQPPGRPPNVDHLFPTPPVEAALAWGRDRLVAAGSGRRAHYVVRDASVIETSLPTTGGLKGALTTEQSERYDARVEIELRIVGDDRRVEGTAKAEAVRSRSVAENVTLAEREALWFKMTEELMEELNGQLEETIKTVFFTHVIQ